MKVITVRVLVCCGKRFIRPEFRAWETFLPPMPSFFQTQVPVRQGVEVSGTGSILARKTQIFMRGSISFACLVLLRFSFGFHAFTGRVIAGRVLAVWDDDGNILEFFVTLER